MIEVESAQMMMQRTTVATSKECRLPFYIIL